MRVLYVASELYPLVKTGGLGDVSAALPPALRRRDVDVRLFLPGLPALREGIEGQTAIASLGPAFGVANVRVFRGRVAESGVPAYLLDAPELFDRPGNPYLDASGRDWPDNHRRFALFGWAAARFADGDWRPDVVHAHDWHAGLAAAWLIANGGERPASVFTIHNLAYQGLVPGERYPELGLPAQFFAVDGLEFYGQASFMKAGLFYSDRITTVSPTYAREICEPEQGCGLDGVLTARGDALVGILNGVDYAVWNPATDRYLRANYDAADLAPKRTNKAALQRELGLTPDPAATLFCAVSRLNRHKGLDLVADAVPRLAEGGGQLALLGSGDADLEDDFRQLARDHVGSVAVTIGYDEPLSHRLIGSSDIILVPSRSEPCGLTQLYGLRYGTLPLVCRVGGLADTVVDATPATLADDTATGFVCARPTPSDFTEAVERVFNYRRQPEVWGQIQRRAMSRDFSWDAAASDYLALYRGLRPAVAQSPGHIAHQPSSLGTRHE